MSAVLDGIRVLDLSSGQGGGIATMVFADFGADVVKVEPPGGDPARSDAAAPMWLRGKRSVTLDLEVDADRDRVRELARSADVVVASFAPDEADRLGLDYVTLSTDHADLVYCSITGWGPRGPYADYPADEGLVAAKAGRMSALEGIVTRAGPAFQAVPVGTHGSTQAAITGVLAALLVRDRTGRGQLVETSLLRGLLPYDLNTLIRVQLTPRYPVHLANDQYASFAPATQPMLGYQPVMGSDGRWIQFANLLEHHFHASLEVTGLLEQVLGNPRYAGAPSRLGEQEREEVRNILLERVREEPATEWMRRMLEYGNVAAEMVGTAQEALNHPDLLANGEVRDLEHPTLGVVRQLGPLARLTETPAEPTGFVATPGQHTDEVLAEPARSPRAHEDQPLPEAPLAGVTVLEFATIIAAPLGAAILGDLGARVIKVEPVDGGDPVRGLGVGLGAMFLVSKTTGSKESICVDLKTEQGREIVRRLLGQADVLIHNYRPGVPERLGIGYEQAREESPDIVWVSVNGYGPDGPGAQRPSAHPVPGAVDGGALRQAGAGWPPAQIGSIEELREAARHFSRANEANPDPNTGVCVASAALLGLYARERTGKGQPIYLSMLGANGYANADDFLAYPGKPDRPLVDADLYGLNALYRLYPASEGWVFLGAAPPTGGESQPWAALCRALGREALADDERFATPEARRANDAALADVLSEVFLERSADEWEQLLIAYGVGCVRADEYPNIGSFLLQSNHAEANDLLAATHHAQWGDYRRWGATATFSLTPERPRAGVLAGQHTDALLRELGYSEADIAALRETRAVWSEQPLDLGSPASV